MAAAEALLQLADLLAVEQSEEAQDTPSHPHLHRAAMLWLQAEEDMPNHQSEDMLPVQSLAEITLLDQSPVVATLHLHPHPLATALAQHQVVTMLAQPLDQSRHPLVIALAPLPDPPLDQPHLTQDNMMLAIRLLPPKELNKR